MVRYRHNDLRTVILFLALISGVSWAARIGGDTVAASVKLRDSSLILTPVTGTDLHGNFIVGTLHGAGVADSADTAYKAGHSHFADSAMDAAMFGGYLPSYFLPSTALPTGTIGVLPKWNKTGSDTLTASNARDTSNVFSTGLDTIKAPAVRTDSLKARLGLIDTLIVDSLNSHGTMMTKSGLFRIATIPGAGVAHDSIAVFDKDTLKFRSKAQVLGDIGAVGGSGTQYYVPLWGSGGTTMGNSNISQVAVGSSTAWQFYQPGGSGVDPLVINPSNIAGLSQFSFYPSSGTNTTMSFFIIPRGTGAANNLAQFVLFNTDFIANSTTYEFLTTRAAGTYFLISSGKIGTGTIRPLIFSAGYAGDLLTNANQLVLAANGFVGINGLPVGLFSVIGTYQSSFQNSTLGNIINSMGTGYSAHYGSYDFCATNWTTPLARIGCELTNNGSYLLFGTSNSYASGITNTALSIDYSANISFPAYTTAGVLCNNASGLISSSTNMDSGAVTNGGYLAKSDSSASGSTHKLTVSNLRDTSHVFSGTPDTLKFPKIIAGYTGNTGWASVVMGNTLDSGNLTVRGNAIINGTTELDGTLDIPNLTDLGSTAPYYMAYSSGYARLRTPSEVLSDIGAQASGSYQPLATNLTSIGNLANGAGMLSNNGSGTFSYNSDIPIQSWIKISAAYDSEMAVFNYGYTHGYTTASPSATMTMEGASQNAARFGWGLTTTTNYPYFQIGTYWGGTWNAALEINGSTTTPSVRIENLLLGDTAHFTNGITVAGPVGIGTTSPGDAVDIVGTARMNALVDSGATNPYIKFVNAAGTYHSYYLQAYQDSVGLGYSWTTGLRMDHSGNAIFPAAATVTVGTIDDSGSICFTKIQTANGGTGNLTPTSSRINITAAGTYTLVSGSLQNGTVIYIYNATGAAPTVVGYYHSITLNSYTFIAAIKDDNGNWELSMPAM